METLKRGKDGRAQPPDLLIFSWHVESAANLDAGLTDRDSPSPITWTTENAPLVLRTNDHGQAPINTCFEFLYSVTCHEKKIKSEGEKQISLLTDEPCYIKLK